MDDGDGLSSDWRLVSVHPVADQLIVAYYCVHCGYLIIHWSVCVCVCVCVCVYTCPLYIPVILPASMALSCSPENIVNNASVQKVFLT